MDTRSNRIAELETKLRAANAAYYNSADAIMEDAAYDALRAELEALAPGHALLAQVGAPAGEILSKVSHSIHMGSLDKAMNRAEFEAWMKTLPANAVIVASLKVDGGSVSLEYSKGRLVRAITRGDGFVGEDITANALQFRNLPTTDVKMHGKEFTGFVRGEIVLFNEDWQVADPDMVSNPRNLGNGIARRKDGEQAELLTVVAFRAHFPNGEEIADTELGIEEHLRKAGFLRAASAYGTADDVWAFAENASAERGTYLYWIDGIVAKLDNIADQRAMGERDNRPKGQIAIKFAASGTPTVLRSVSYTVGHTGAIIPTGKFDPVRLGGTTVSSALLCNWDVIRALDIAIGDTVTIYKAGEIIPKVLHVIERPANRVLIAEPTACPICGGPVGKKRSVHGEESAMLYCLNEDCSSKVTGKIDRFTRSLNILGIGDGVLEAMVSKLGLKNAADLYHLASRRSDLESLQVGDKGIRLGAKRAQKIIDEIEKVRELTLSEFLGSLGIDGLGKRRVALIQAAVPGQLDTVDQWLSGRLADIAQPAGVPNMGRFISASVSAKKDLIQSFLANGVTIKATVQKAVVAGAKSFCFTGTLSVPRAELVAIAENDGHVVKDDVANGLTYLVMADANSTSSKAAKARKQGTVCINEEEFRRLVGA